MRNRTDAALTSSESRRHGVGRHEVQHHRRGVIGIYDSGDRIEGTDFEDRVFELSDEMIMEMYDEAGPAVEEKIRKYDEEHPEG